MMAISLGDTASFDLFTPAVKACRDILVDDVERHLGVPVVGRPLPVRSLAVGDVEAARRRLSRAIERLDSDSSPPGPHVRACRQQLELVAGLLGAARSTGNHRLLRLARRRLGAAVDHLTTVLFAQPDGER